MRVWKNVVTGRQRSRAGMPRGLAAVDVPRCAAGRGPSQAGCGRQQVGAELGDPVVVVAEQHVGGSDPRSSRDGAELLEVVDHGDAGPVDVEAVAGR